MKFKILAALIFAGNAAFAQDLTGIWQTEAGETGGFLHVSIAPCGDKVCGSINRAFDKDLQVISDYPHAGKPIIWDMSSSGDGSWSGGKIWAPDTDKTYKSKMEMVGDNLKVSGCVLVICRSQVWRKAN